jgi:hypothetical protein
MRYREHYSITKPMRPLAYAIAWLALTLAFATLGVTLAYWM